MIRRRSSRSTSTGMLRMRLPMCSWGGATASMRSKYGFGRMCGKTSIFMVPAESDDRAGGGEGFARDLGGRARPRLRVGRLVARVARVALGGDPGEELAEGDGAGSRRQSIGG